MSAAEFAASVDRLIRATGHWEQARWRARPSPSAPTRGEAVYALVQRLADRGADAEGRPHRDVPRHGDLVLPDQVRVMADDLLTGADETVLRQATDDVNEVRGAL